MALSKNSQQYLESLWGERLRKLTKERASKLDQVRQGLMDPSQIYARKGFRNFLQPDLDHVKAIGIARSECWLMAHKLDGQSLSQIDIDEILQDAASNMDCSANALIASKRNEMQSAQPIPSCYSDRIPEPSELSSLFAEVQYNAKERLRRQLTIQMCESRGSEQLASKAQASASSPRGNQTINVQGPNVRVNIESIDNSTNVARENASLSEAPNTAEEGVAESSAKTDDPLARWKKKKPVAYLLAFAAVIGGIASFTDSVSKIQNVVEGRISPVRTIKLPFDTGWILAGYYDQSTKRFSQGHYIEIAKTNYSDKQELPRIGDWVRVSGERHVVISEYKKKGLEQQMQAPLADLNDEDYTGVTLPSGTVMEVRDIGGGSYPGRASAVWVRVGAIPR